MRISKLFITSLLFCISLLLAEPVSGASVDTHFPGGILEKSATAASRPRLTVQQINTFMIQDRGLFTFPAPYNTQGVRLTIPSDCPRQNDCVEATGYSYWAQMNNHVGSDSINIILGLDGDLGGSGINLFTYNKKTDAVTKVGSLFAGTSINTGTYIEMVYFSGTDPNMVYVPQGSVLMRIDVMSKKVTPVIDISPRFGKGSFIWQTHTSSDDKVHSFTAKNQNGTALGCGAYDESKGAHWYYPAKGDFDECEIDASGRFLVIKENVDGLNGEDNRIIDLVTGQEKMLFDPQGAGGHSSNGYELMVAADNFNPLPDAVRVWSLAGSFDGRNNGLVVYHNPRWDTGLVGLHTSFLNGRSRAALKDQYACNSSLSKGDIARGNEVYCYLLDGSFKVLVVAPVMTDPSASGGRENYYKPPKGMLDVTGKYMLFTSNLGTNRLDAFLVKIPSQLLLNE